jgi:hypothetical protein
MYLPALNGYVMPVEVGRQEVRATAAIAATASAALKVAENTASASLKEAEASERFSDMKTASLKALETDRAHLQRRVLASDKEAADLKVKLFSAKSYAKSSAKELSSTRLLLHDAQSSTTQMAEELSRFDSRDKSQSGELSRLNHAFQTNLITAERHRAACDSLIASNTKCVRALPFPSFLLHFLLLCPSFFPSAIFPVLTRSSLPAF